MRNSFGHNFCKTRPNWDKEKVFLDDFDVMRTLKQVLVAIEHCKHHFFHYLANTEAQAMEAGPRRCSLGGVNYFIKTIC